MATHVLDPLDKILQRHTNKQNPTSQQTRETWEWVREIMIWEEAFYLDGQIQAGIW